MGTAVVVEVEVDEDNVVENSSEVEDGSSAGMDVVDDSVKLNSVVDG